MKIFSNALKRTREYFSELKAETIEFRRQLETKKRERHWKKKKERVFYARQVCEGRLRAELLDQYRQKVMTARVSEARIAGVWKISLEALDSAGIKTAYDVYRKGENGLCEVATIGPKRARSLFEWASNLSPDSVAIDRRDPAYIRRLRFLKRQHFGLPSADSEPPPPNPKASNRSHNYGAGRGRDGSIDEGIGSCEVDHYSVLGAPRDATQEQIRGAYRQRMREYHPDKVAHLGPELRALAEKKAKEINAAYEALRH